MANDSFYKPSGNIKDTNRTHVPDMYRQAAAEMMAEDVDNKASVSTHRTVSLQRRPMVGVLYSISSGVEGELFPVYLGRNTIGSDPSCDICLRETSVSAMHGLLLTRRIIEEDGHVNLTVYLSDNNSKYGTAVNAEKLCFDKVFCSQGDIISIGSNYVFTLALFDNYNKLSVAFDFDPIAEPEQPEPMVSENTNVLPNSQDGSPITASFKPTDSKAENKSQDASFDFYRPSNQQGSDHYNNKTIIL